MPKFMLLLHRSPEEPVDQTPDDMRATIEKLRRWLAEMHSTGRYVVSDKLMEEGGKVVTRRDGRVTVTDGPYSESKEVIGGYFTIRASDYDEAVAIVRDCPFLEHGTIVVRQTDPTGCGEE
jgi:hypothetical protein